MAMSRDCFGRRKWEQGDVRAYALCFVLFVVLSGNGCANLSGTSHRTLQRSDLLLNASLWSTPAMVREPLEQGAFKLFRLIPAAESNGREHGVVRFSPRWNGVQWKDNNDVFLVVEKTPVAVGKLENGMVHFRLPDSLEPSTHCFVMVGHGSWAIPTSAFGNVNERLFIGLYPFSKKYRSLTTSTVEEARERASQVFADRELQCEGMLEDFLSTKPGLKVVG